MDDLDRILTNMIHVGRRKTGMSSKEFNQFKNDIERGFIDGGWLSPEKKLKALEEIDKIINLHVEIIRRSNEISQFTLIPTISRDHSQSDDLEQWEQEALKAGWTKPDPTR